MGWALQITSGRGPVEVRRFVGRLAPRLAAVLSARGVAVRARTLVGPEDAPASVSLVLEGGRPPVGDLLGTHCLIERSPHRSRRSRKRWFAAVVLLDLPDIEPVGLLPGEVDLRACRARGPGGQHVNKKATAIRATHRLTGLSVRAEGSRSQADNRAAALAGLVRELAARSEAARSAARQARRRAHDAVERGAPVMVWCAVRLGGEIQQVV
jgi:peptide chain release factor 2/peptide chain release factor